MVSLLSIFAPLANAIDIIKIPKPQSKHDKRNVHKELLLNRAMTVTQAKYGDFKISFDAPKMKRARVYEMMQSGEIVNMYFSPPKKKWFEGTLVVPVPLRKGILNYRLLVIHKNNAKNFHNVNTLSQLQQFRSGSQAGWSTSEILKYNNINFVESHNFDGLFHMLNNRRFDFLLRGIHEVYDELESRKEETSELIVAEGIAVHVHSPSYIYISKKHPRLFERVTEGLNILANSGELNAIFEKFFADDIHRAKLSNRNVIYLTPAFDTNTDTELNPDWWFSHKDIPLFEVNTLQ